MTDRPACALLEPCARFRRQGTARSRLPEPNPGGDMTQRAVLLTGSIGLGHEMMARSCAALLEGSGWRTRSLNSMDLLGQRSGAAGERLFGRLVTVPGLYDGLHFAHLRTGSRLAGLMDAGASARLMPALRAELDREPADLVLSVFATGALAAARLKREAPGRRTVVLCTDVAVHRLWVREGTDLFLVTSPAAAASVRRYLPRAAVAVVPPPVRAAFYDAPSQPEARAALGVPPGEPRVLARTRLRVRPFGFTGRVPELMAAADVVVALPGATTAARPGSWGARCCCSTSCPGTGGTTCCTSSSSVRPASAGRPRPASPPARWRCWTRPRAR